MNGALTFTLEFNGGESDEHLIDFYDVARALQGFQRSLALTTHLVVNGEIITQAPSLKGARVLAKPPEDGSWKTTAVVLAGIYSATTAPIDTPLGHVVHSLYDLMISESLGIHVDYEKTLGQLYEEHKQKQIESPKNEQHQVDSLIDKCSSSIVEIHRPIYKNKTALIANISSQVGQVQRSVGGTFDLETFEYMHEEFTDEAPEYVEGKVSSYSNNSYTGRLYVASEGWAVPFELVEHCRTTPNIRLMVASLSVNAVKEFDSEWSSVYCKVYKTKARSGRLKRYVIVAVSHEPIQSQ
jgi:hypothetical protein